MISRQLACRVAPLLRGSNVVVASVSPRFASQFGGRPEPDVHPVDMAELDAQQNRWREAHALYFGPERDMKNFPTPKLEMYSPPARLFFIPDWFFTQFYNKTGQSGPYMLMTGLGVYLLSKEKWMVKEDSIELGFFLVVAYVAHKFGATIRKQVDASRTFYDKLVYFDVKEKAKQVAMEKIGIFETTIEQQKYRNHMFAAQRENIGMQLEARYRKRLADVHAAVMARLNYQVDMSSTKVRLQQEHASAWIIDSVKKAISPQQEKQAIKSCIDALKTLKAA